MERNNLNGWNMLDSYHEGQAIYGRDSEISAITESITYNIQTFIYGKSGIGKTSIIQAGIFPRLRQLKFFPVVIRLIFYNNESLNSVIKRLVEEEAYRANAKIGKPSLKRIFIDDADVSTASLYEYFSKVKFEDECQNIYIPVLIFDQFEETINNEENWQRTVDFLRDDLYDLMDNSDIIHGKHLPYTNYRIVFSMREDYLYCLEDIIDNFSFWELRYNRFRIKALTDENAQEIIIRTSGQNGLELGNEKKIIHAIIYIAKNNNSTRFTEINTALLSLTCSLLWTNSINGCVYYNDLRKLGSYLNSYYDDTCSRIGRKATRYLEKELLTKDGRRNSVDEREAIGSKKVSIGQLDYLVNNKLLRRIKTDNTSIRYEYIHDLFAKMVYNRKRKDKRSILQPEICNVSKRLGLTSFLKQFIITSCAIFILTYLWLLFHASTVHNTYDVLSILNIKVCIWTGLALAFCVYLAYISPILIERLHDVNHSGWKLILVPISLSLFFQLVPLIEKYTLVPERLYFGIKILCLTPVIYLILLLFQKSAAETYHGNYSIRYEAVYHNAPTDNVEFLKLFTIELLYYATGCYFTEMLYYYMSDIDIWQPFTLKQPLLFSETGFYDLHISSCPFVVAIFVALLMFSPALGARIHSIGYNSALKYIPYLNIIFLIVACFPDTLLKKIRLLRENKITVKSEDDIFELIGANGIPQNNKPTSYNKYDALYYFSLLIPIYGFIKILVLAKKTPVGLNILSYYIIVSSNCLYACFLLPYLYENVNEIVFCFTYIIILIELISSSMILIIQIFLIDRAIVEFLRHNPTCSLTQVAKALDLPFPHVERIMEKLKNKGIVERGLVDDNICWVINESKKENNI